MNITPRKTLITLIPLVVFIGLGALFWRGLGLDPHLVPSVLIDKPAPAFNTQSLYKSPHHLSNLLLKGHVSIFHVFASWCSNCKHEHPLLMKVASESPVPIYGLDYKDSSKKARAWLTRHGNPYRQIGIDPKGDIAINWGVYGVPETFIIDRQGRIRYKQVGELTPEIWQKEMLPLIKKLKHA